MATFLLVTQPERGGGALVSSFCPGLVTWSGLAGWLELWMRSQVGGLYGWEYGGPVCLRALEGLYRSLPPFRWEEINGYFIK